MEVKEAIKWLFDIWHEWENVYGTTAEINLIESKKYDEVIDLLKSLESENKRLKKENEAYKGMWGELYGLVKKWKLYPREMMMDMIRKKYLNNGENNGTEKY